MSYQGRAASVRDRWALDVTGMLRQHSLTRVPTNVVQHTQCPVANGGLIFVTLDCVQT